MKARAKSWPLAQDTLFGYVTLVELNEYMNRTDITDPWGTEYRMTCARGVQLISAGEDGKFGTLDDLGSHLE